MSNTSTSTPTILGIDPGTRFLGAAVLRGRRLLRYAVHELRNGERIYDLLGQARSIVFQYIERYSPQVVALEKPYVLDSDRAVTLRALVRELRKRSKEFGLSVAELSPEEVRTAIVGSARATKHDVAGTLVERFPELRPLLPRRPKIPALWLSSKDRYWLHAFDGVSVAIAASRFSAHPSPLGGATRKDSLQL
jgi:Holliday junction resolvasome RuvABC endonuclease subunit